MRIIQNIYECIVLFLDLFVPRFITETVLVDQYEHNGKWYIVCSEEALNYNYTKDIKYKCKAKVRALNVFGNIHFVKIVHIQNPKK